MLYKIKALEINCTASNGGTFNKYQLINTETNKTVSASAFKPELIDPKCNRIGNTVEVDLITKGSFTNISTMSLVKEGIYKLQDSHTNTLFQQLMGKLEELEEDEEVKQEASFAKDLLIENKEKFITWPAAKSNHHNFGGGLLMHTFEVADHIWKYEEEHKLAAIAAIIHDVGKIHEYIFDPETGSIEMNTAWIEMNLSHTFWMTAMLNSEGFYALQNMIASHHKCTEWGALRDIESRNTPNVKDEEWILHLSDMWSARAGINSIEKLEKIYTEEGSYYYETK